MGSGAGGHANHDGVEARVGIQSVVLTYVPSGKIRRRQVEREGTVVRAVLSRPGGHSAAPTAGQMGTQPQKRQLSSQSGIDRWVMKSIVQGRRDSGNGTRSNIETDRLIVH